VEEEDEFVGEDFQEDEFVNEEFKHRDAHDDVEHEDVDDPSQGFVHWDCPPTYVKNKKTCNLTLCVCNV
jgi:hypothetical protein